MMIELGSIQKLYVRDRFISARTRAFEIFDVSGVLVVEMRIQKRQSTH